MSFWSSLNYDNNYSDIHYGLFGLIIPLTILDLILRGISLWKAAKKDQRFWFVSLLIINSVGILPLTYLLLNRETNDLSKKLSKKKLT